MLAYPQLKFGVLEKSCHMIPRCITTKILHGQDTQEATFFSGLPVNRTHWGAAVTGDISKLQIHNK